LVRLLATFVHTASRRGMNAPYKQGLTSSRNQYWMLPSCFSCRFHVSAAERVAAPEVTPAEEACCEYSV
jgi:hypothetical protein